VVTTEFRKQGHEAYSCDLIDCSGNHPEWHIKNDAVKIAYDLSYGWDVMIGFPPCTYSSNSGVQHLWKDIKRWDMMIDGALFFKKLLDAPISVKVIENPIMHKYALKIIGKKYSQIIQPYDHGHAESKATCLWVEGLPLLQKSNDVKEEWKRLPKNKAQRLFYLPPGKERAKERSKTYIGIAKAMANQWG